MGAVLLNEAGGVVAPTAKVPVFEPVSNNNRVPDTVQFCQGDVKVAGQTGVPVPPFSAGAMLPKARSGLAGS